MAIIGAMSLPTEHRAGKSYTCESLPYYEQDTGLASFH